METNGWFGYYVSKQISLYEGGFLLRKTEAENVFDIIIKRQSAYFIGKLDLNKWVEKMVKNGEQEWRISYLLNYPLILMPFMKNSGCSILDSIKYEPISVEDVNAILID